MPLTKEKKKLNKLIQESDSDDSEHELAYYVNDRVKLMKEVLKTIKPKKIKAMAPPCLKHMEMEEINSMLLEELLGISNKRLKYIFNGQNLDEDSSSSTNEDEPIDIISLDDVSEDEFAINLDDDENGSSSKSRKVKKEYKHSKIKKEKCLARKVKKESEKNVKNPDNSENKQDENLSSDKLMSVLELLELQARARAIKSQLLLENSKSQDSCSTTMQTVEEKIGSDDDVIIETVKAEEIVITSSESESESSNKGQKSIGLSINKAQSNDGENNGTETTGHDCSNDGETKTKTSDVPHSSKKGQVKIIENKLIPTDGAEKNSDKDRDRIKASKGNGKNNEKPVDNDEIIVINLSNDEIDELK